MSCTYLLAALVCVFGVGCVRRSFICEGRDLGLSGLIAWRVQVVLSVAFICSCTLASIGEERGNSLLCPMLAAVFMKKGNDGPENRHHDPARSRRRRRHDLQTDRNGVSAHHAMNSPQIVNRSFTITGVPKSHSPADAEGMRITPPFSHPSPRPAREQPQYPPTGITAPAKMAGAVSL